MGRMFKSFVALQKYTHRHTHTETENLPFAGLISLMPATAGPRQDQSWESGTPAEFPTQMLGIQALEP